MQHVLRSSFDTSSVPVPHRLDLWEERCSASVVGLTCSTMEEAGLRARFDHYDFGTFSVFDIAGQPHVISRSAETLRKHEKDSVFLTVIKEGTVFVNRRKRCDVLGAGDVILYDTNTPYMHGFASTARQIVFDLPGPEFRARFPGWDLRDTLRIDGNTGDGGLIARSVCKTYSDVRARKYLAADPLLVDDLWSVLEQTRDLVSGGAGLSSYHAGILRRVRAFVRARLEDGELDTGQVAAEIGMSSRQLNRILAQRDLTVKKLIDTERLAAARRLIEAAAPGQVSLSELAYRFGFASPSHFSRSFRRHHGVAPSELLRHH